MQTEKTLRILFRFITRPLTGFVCYLFVVSIIILAERSGQNIMVFYLVMPWIALAVIALNMPFIALVFRRFTYSEAIKKNHALEHGTLFFLRKRYGIKGRIGGRAELNGFRIYGVKNKEHLVNAFNDLIQELKRGNSELIITMRCSSNIATAQGLGIILLSIATIILLISGAERMTSLISLIVCVALYFILRTRLGNWVQSKFFMSLDFSNARIQSIYMVEKKDFLERNPIFFVKTDIS